MANPSFEWMSCVLTDLAAFAKANRLTDSEQAFQDALETVQDEVRRKYHRSGKAFQRRVKVAVASSSAAPPVGPDRAQSMRLRIVASRE